MRPSAGPTEHPSSPGPEHPAVSEEVRSRGEWPDPLRAEFVERLLTIADVADLPSDLPSGDVLYELEDGRLLIGSLVGGERLLTIADVDDLPTDLPSGDVRYELEDGRLIVMSPTGASHGNVESNLAYLLTVAKRKVGGRVFCGEVGIVLGRGPDTLFGGDLAYYAAASLPVRETREGYIETPPDIVVEIRIKNDRPARIGHKIDRYLDAGVKEVWSVDPAARAVVIRRLGVGPRRFAGDEILTTDLIPGFEFPLAEVFG